VGDIFRASEVVEIGIQIEVNGKDFYDTLVKQTENEKAKALFKYLAKEEEKHIIAFQRILDVVQTYEPAEAYTDEYFAYMGALAEEHVFTKKDKGVETAKNITNNEEAVELAISFEKDSIIFYDGVKKAVHENEHKIIDSLIDQEKTHLNKLMDLKNSL
jgi:rubrerythrin